MKKLRYVISMILLYIVVVLAVAAPSCSGSTIEKAKKASADFAGYANEVVNTTRDLYRAKVISGDIGLKIAEGSVKLAKGGQAFDALIKALETQYGSADKIPKSAWLNLLANFNTEIVDAFIALLAVMKINVSEQIRKTVDLIIVAVKIIARAFNSSVESQVSKQISGALAAQ